jgi:hypothetical protein
MSLRHPVRRAGLATATALLVVGGVLAAPASAAPPTTAGTAVAQQAVEPASGGRLQPVTPGRLLDTRERGGPVQAGEDRRLRVLGQRGVPESGVQAVVLNVTVTQGSQRADLQVYPVGQRPLQRTSNLNWLPGQTVAVQVQTGVGTDGQVAFSVGTGSAHVVVDVFGWYGDGSAGTGSDAGSGYQALTPTRLLDTREDGGAVEAAAPRTVPVAGQAGVPEDATAVMLNATLLGTPANADLQVFPTGQRPVQRTSNLNVSRGQTRANAVLAPLGEGGSVGLSVSQHSGHVVLDVLGWFSPQGTGRFVSLAPARVLDTRVDPEGTRTRPAPVSADRDRREIVANTGGVPRNADAAVLSVTATGASDPLDVQLYPTGDRPERRTSTLNLQPGTAVPNAAVAPLGIGGEIGISVSQGSAHVVLDVVGYHTSAAWSECVNPEAAWTAQYPGHWRTNAATDGLPQCSVFDPQPFTLPESTEIPLGLAVQLRVEPRSLADARSDPASETRDEREATVDGRTAYRQERTQTEATTIPEGTRYTLWLVELSSERTLHAAGYDVAGTDHEHAVQVLDAMMDRLELHEAAVQTQAVQVFLSRVGEGTDCGRVEAVERRVEATPAVATAALRALFEGPTREEQERGLSWFSRPGTEQLLRSLRVEDGTAYLDLDRSLLDLHQVSTSCGATAFLATVGETLRQFPTVDEVRYAVAGDPAPFYEHLQIGCPAPAAPGDRCDPAPFRG